MARGIWVERNKAARKAVKERTAAFKAKNEPLREARYDDRDRVKVGYSKEEWAKLTPAQKKALLVGRSPWGMEVKRATPRKSLQ